MDIFHIYMHREDTFNLTLWNSFTQDNCKWYAIILVTIFFVYFEAPKEIIKVLCNKPEMLIKGSVSL